MASCPKRPLSSHHPCFVEMDPGLARLLARFSRAAVVVEVGGGRHVVVDPDPENQHGLSMCIHDLAMAWRMGIDGLSVRPGTPGIFSTTGL